VPAGRPALGWMLMVSIFAQTLARLAELLARVVASWPGAFVLYVPLECRGDTLSCGRPTPA
jgi:hypothetical protein